MALRALAEPIAATSVQDLLLTEKAGSALPQQKVSGGLASKSRLEMTASAPLALRSFFFLPPISCFNLCS